MVVRTVLILLLLILPCFAQPSGFDFIRHNGRLVRHPQSGLPWRVKASDNRHQSAVSHALSEWNRAGRDIGIPALFTLVNSASDADMVLDWSGKGLPPNKAGGVWWSFGAEVRIKKMVMDPHHRIPEGNRAQILLQEFGHVLGLGDSSNRKDVMHPVMHTKRRRRVKSARLSRRDVEAFRWLYGQSDFMPIVSPSRKQAKVEPLPPSGAPTGLLHLDPIKVDLTNSVNVRVSVRNNGSEVVRAPISISLYIRSRGDASWSHLKSWQGISKVVPGHRHSRDYFSDMMPIFQARFELLAKVQRTDTKEVLAERTYP